MPRIRLRDLEAAQRDPKAFRESLLAASDRRYRYSYYMALRDAISRFHRNDVFVEARRYLERQLNKKFKSTAKIGETLDHFDWYVEDYISRGSLHFESRLNLTVQLPSFVPRDTTCGGQIGRVDIVAGGYAAWLFRNDSIDGWKHELQSPLIQRGIADLLNAQWEEISVGVYGFQSMLVETCTYSEKEIRSATRALGKLLRAMGY